MKIVTKVKDLISLIKNINGKVGFVPTMGALHEGHLSLMQNSKNDNDITVVSIFVNPRQFGENEDLGKYPRPKNKDISLCKSLDIDILFMPEESSIYQSSDEVRILAPKNMAQVFEGEIRKGHFDGVLSVLIKFFNIIKPQNAYFGKKDAQQLLIVKHMIKDLFLDINIIACDTKRDKHNLALSSRNIYLDKNAYNNALKIPYSLENVLQAVLSGENNSIVLEKIALECLAPLEIDYCKIVDFNLEAIKTIKKDNSLLILAVRVDGVRLLDNYWF